MLSPVSGIEVGGGDVASVGIGGEHPLALVAGPCVLEAPQRVFAIAAALCGICAELGLPLIFKASFDKANRTSLDGHRGPGLEAGLALLGEVRRTLSLLIWDRLPPDLRRSLVDSTGSAAVRPGSKSGA